MSDTTDEDPEYEGMPLNEAGDGISGEMIGEIECKRMYMPGVKIASACPKCDTVYEIDLSDGFASITRSLPLPAPNLSRLPRK